MHYADNDYIVFDRKIAAVSVHTRISHWAIFMSYEGEFGFVFGQSINMLDLFSINTAHACFVN